MKKYLTSVLFLLSGVFLFAVRPVNALLCSPAASTDSAFWTLFFMQLIVIAMLFYVLSKKMKK